MSIRHKKPTSISHKRSGRSIEEIILAKKLSQAEAAVDGSDPTSWPDPKHGNSSISIGQLKSSSNNNNNNNQKSLTLSSSLPHLYNPNEGIVNSTKGVSFSNSNQVIHLPSTSKDTQSIMQPDKDELLESVKTYCKALEQRVQDLEGQLSSTIRVMNKELAKANVAIKQARSSSSSSSCIQSRPPSRDPKYNNININNDPRSPTKSMTTFKSTSPSPLNTNRGGNNSLDFQPQTGPGPGEQLQQWESVDIKLLNLNELFRKGLNPLELRTNSATVINTCVRGWLARCRLNHYIHGMKEWRWSRCKMSVYVVDMLLENQSLLAENLARMKLKREMRTAQVVFIKWSIVCKQSAPLRKTVRIEAEARYQAKRIRVLGIGFQAFKSVSVGMQSVKGVNKERRLVVDGIRDVLSKQYIKRGQLGVVPEWEVKRMMRKHVVTTFLAKKEKLFVHSIFINGFKRNVDICRRLVKEASNKWFQVIVGKCFRAWSEYNYLISQGLDRKRWPGPRKYEVRYNQKRVDHFSRKRLLLYVFRPLKGFFNLQSKIRKCFQRQTSRFVQLNFRAWVKVTKSLRKLRILVISNWKGYGRFMIRTPFEAWSQYVKSAKNHMAEQIRIVNSYLRWKWRQKMSLIVKTWRHQALYGRVDGMYTRQMLLKSLGEQKIMTNSLEKMMATQTIELEECKVIVDGEMHKRRDLEMKLSNAFAETNRFRMIVHNIEQEIGRLNAIIGVMGQLNPRQIQHLKLLQPAFKFSERYIKVSDDNDEESNQDNENASESANNNNSSNNNSDAKDGAPSEISDDDLNDDDMSEVGDGMRSDLNSLLSGSRNGSRKSSIAGGGGGSSSRSRRNSNGLGIGLGLLDDNNNSSVNSRRSSLSSAKGAGTGGIGVEGNGSVNGHGAMSVRNLDSSSKPITTTINTNSNSSSNINSIESTATLNKPLNTNTSTSMTSPVPVLAPASSSVLLIDTSLNTNMGGSVLISKEEAVVLDRMKWFFSTFKVRPDVPLTDITYIPAPGPDPAQHTSTTGRSSSNTTSRSMGSAPTSPKSPGMRHSPGTGTGTDGSAEEETPTVWPTVLPRAPILPVTHLPPSSLYADVQVQVLATVPGPGPAPGPSPVLVPGTAISTDSLDSSSRMNARSPIPDMNTHMEILDFPTGMNSMKDGSPSSEVLVHLQYDMNNITKTSEDGLLHAMPQIVVHMKGSRRKKAAFRAAFSAAVSASVAAVLHAVKEDHLSMQTLLLTDFLGLGSEYVAGRMLEGVLDFIQTGDASSFAPEDRREWTKHILHSAIPQQYQYQYSDNSTQTSAPAAAAHLTSDKKVIMSVVQSAVVEVQPSLNKHAKPTVQPKILHSAYRALDLDSAADVILNDNPNTWRNALMALRTLHPSNGPGDRDRESYSTHDGIYGRILNMKDNISTIVQQQKYKYRHSVERVARKEVIKTSEAGDGRVMASPGRRLEREKDKDSTANSTSTEVLEKYSREILKHAQDSDDSDESESSDEATDEDSEASDNDIDNEDSDLDNVMDTSNTGAGAYSIQDSTSASTSAYSTRGDLQSKSSEANATVTNIYASNLNIGVAFLGMNK